MSGSHPYDRFAVDRIEGLDAALKRYLRDSGLGWMMQHRDIVTAWCRCAGPDLTAETRVRAFRGGTLYVDVYSPARKAELELFGTDLLVRTLRDELGDKRLRTLRFTLAEPPPDPRTSGDRDQTADT